MTENYDEFIDFNAFISIKIPFTPKSYKIYSTVNEKKRNNVQIVQNDKKLFYMQFKVVFFKSIDNVFICRELTEMVFMLYGKRMKCTVMLWLRKNHLMTMAHVY